MDIEKHFVKILLVGIFAKFIECEDLLSEESKRGSGAMNSNRMNDRTHSGSVGQPRINNGREAIKTSSQRSQNAFKSNFNLTRLKIIAPFQYSVTFNPHLS